MWNVIFTALLPYSHWIVIGTFILTWLWNIYVNLFAMNKETWHIDLMERYITLNLIRRYGRGQ